MTVFDYIGFAMIVAAGLIVILMMLYAAPAESPSAREHIILEWRFRDESWRVYLDWPRHQYDLEQYDPHQHYDVRPAMVPVFGVKW